MGFNNATEETRYLCLVLAQNHAASQSQPSTATQLANDASILEKFIREGKAE